MHKGLNKYQPALTVLIWGKIYKQQLILDLQKLVLLPLTRSSIFWHKLKDTSIHYQASPLKWSSLGRSAAGCFSPAYWQLIQVVWVLDGALVRVTVKLCVVGWRPLLSLHYHFSWLSALCGPYQGLFHLFTFVWHFSWIPCPPSGPPAILPLLSLPDIIISGPTLVKIGGKLFFWLLG